MGEGKTGVNAKPEQRSFLPSPSTVATIESSGDT